MKLWNSLIYLSFLNVFIIVFKAGLKYCLTIMAQALTAMYDPVSQGDLSKSVQTLFGFSHTTIIY